MARTLKAKDIIENGFIVLEVFHKEILDETIEALRKIGPTWKDLKLNEDIYNITDVMEDEDTELEDDVKCDLTRVQDNCERICASYFRISFS